jgi:hypothetical protein
LQYAKRPIAGLKQIIYLIEKEDGFVGRGYNKIIKKKLCR